MKKRGISPLIATVLILGFTVALAAVIMTWGTGFTKTMTKQTEETSGIQVTCATDVMFEVQKVCETATNGEYKILIANNGNKKIEKFTIRFYKSGSDVKSVPKEDFNSDGDTGLEAFGIEAEDVASGYTGNKEVFQVDVIPIISIGGKDTTCAQNIGTFGDVDNTDPIDEC